VDEMRAGDGLLEALKQGILNRRKITGEGTMVLQEYEVCAGGKIIKVHTVEIEQDPEVEGGKEDIMISEKITAEQKSVARGEGTIRICMLEKGKFSTLSSPAHGGGTILAKGKVRQLEANTMHKFEAEKSKTLEKEEISTMRCLEKYMRYRKLKIVGV